MSGLARCWSPAVNTKGYDFNTSTDECMLLTHDQVRGPSALHETLARLCTVSSVRAGRRPNRIVFLVTPRTWGVNMSDINRCQRCDGQGRHRAACPRHTKQSARTPWYSLAPTPPSRTLQIGFITWYELGVISSHLRGGGSDQTKWN